MRKTAMTVILLIILFLALGLAGVAAVVHGILHEKGVLLIGGVFIACGGLSAALYLCLHPV
jgi:hypothetical protein